MNLTDREQHLIALAGISAIGSNLQAHHRSQDEMARLLKEQNALLAAQLEEARIQSATARGLVRYNGEDITPQEYNQIIERQKQQKEEFKHQEKLRKQRERLEQAKRELLQREQQELEIARKAAWEKAKEEGKVYQKKIDAKKQHEEQKRKARLYLEKFSPGYAESLREQIENNNLSKRMVALAIAADGQFSPQEFDWVEALWGHGVSQWLVEIMRTHSLSETQSKLSKLCKSTTKQSIFDRIKNNFSKSKECARTLIFWAVAAQLQHLGEVDGITKNELDVIEALKESIIGPISRDWLLKIPEADLVACFESWKLTNYMLFLGLRITSMVVQRGNSTSEEISWVQNFWGRGSWTQVTALASVNDLESLICQVSEFGKMADKVSLLEFWCLLSHMDELASLAIPDSVDTFYKRKLMNPVKDTILSSEAIRG